MRCAGSDWRGLPVPGLIVMLFVLALVMLPRRSAEYDGVAYDDRSIALTGTRQLDGHTDLERRAEACCQFGREHVLCLVDHDNRTRRAHPELLDAALDRDRTAHRQ